MKWFEVGLHIGKLIVVEVVVKGPGSLKGKGYS
jgi:hypothetical protein